MTVLQRIQQDFAAYLQTVVALSNIKVVAIRDLTSAGVADAALAVVQSQSSKVGACLQVRMPYFELDSQNNDRAFLQIVVPVWAQELPEKNDGPNGTGMTSEDIAIETAASGLSWKPGYVNSWRIDRQAITPSLDFLPRITHQIQFRAGYIVPSSTRTAAPSIGAVAGTVTITDNEVGADVYYTTDESYPWSGNDEATLYAGAFVLPASAVVRAASYKSGKDGSDAAILSVTV